LGVVPFGKERYRPSGWIVLDAIDVVVHVFSRETRDFYALESLWKDAETLPLSEVLKSEEAISSDG